MIRRIEEQIGRDIPQVVASELHISKVGYQAEGDCVLALSLRGCGLQRMPDAVCELGSLQILSLGENEIADLPAKISKLRQLKQFYLFNNPISKLPVEIGELSELEILDIGHNALTSIPESIGKLKKLQFLYVSDNKLSTLPDSLGGLDTLIYLSMADNQFTELPASVCRLKSLKELRIYNNKIARLPAAIGQLSELRELHARGNRLTELPEAIGDLQNLYYLDLRGNLLSELPDSIGKLKELRKLDLRWNKIASRPLSIPENCTIYIQGEPMDNLTKLSELLKSQNQIQHEISRIIKRPALHGHIVEFMAANIFDIQLNQNAAQKGMDGVFKSGPLKGKAVDIKYHGKHEGLLNINPKALPDYYLVLTGPKAAALSSRNSERPFTIHFVFLLDASSVVSDLKSRGVKIGIAAAIKKSIWDSAEIYPTKSQFFPINDDQALSLKLFRS